MYVTDDIAYFTLLRLHFSILRHFAGLFTPATPTWLSPPPSRHYAAICRFIYAAAATLPPLLPMMPRRCRITRRRYADATLTLRH
jgi:hypothetical protein